MTSISKVGICSNGCKWNNVVYGWGRVTTTTHSLAHSARKRAKSGEKQIQWWKSRFCGGDLMRLPWLFVFDSLHHYIGWFLSFYHIDHVNSMLYHLFVLSYYAGNRDFLFWQEFQFGRTSMFVIWKLLSYSSNIRSKLLTYLPIQPSQVNQTCLAHTIKQKMGSCDCTHKCLWG